MHGFPSSHTTVVPALHVPPLQTSPVVHLLPSLQLAVLFVYLQPDVGSQLSFVQPF